MALSSIKSIAQIQAEAGEEGKKMPVLNGMRSLRLRMEGWVEENCERGMGLKGMIGRMEAITKEKLRRSGRA